MLLKKDSTVFMPILCQRHPNATIVSASLLHKLYGNKLVSWYIATLYMFYLSNPIVAPHKLELFYIFDFEIL